MISEEYAESDIRVVASSAEATTPDEKGRKRFDTQLRRSDLVNRKPVRVKREGRDIVCVLVDETVYAFTNRCPHTGYLMHEGRVRGCVVTCISHLAQFDLRDGHVVQLPMEGRSIETGPLAVYPVVEQDGVIFVDLPEE
jgi:3-phenylpropionate/trans-cinnamate dioxygenase ferredoxin component